MTACRETRELIAEWGQCLRCERTVGGTWSGECSVMVAWMDASVTTATTGAHHSGTLIIFQGTQGLTQKGNVD